LEFFIHKENYCELYFLAAGVKITPGDYSQVRDEILKTLASVSRIFDIHIVIALSNSKILSIQK